MNRTNTDFIFECNSEIHEFDIRSCNTSICREYELLSKKMLDTLDAYPKWKREIKFGILRGKDRELSKAHSQKVDEVVSNFIKVNGLTSDDIISIKNDAVFVINKEVQTTTFGDYIEFKDKNVYHAYLYLKPFEFFFKEDGDIDIKNFTKDENIIELHKNGILTIINEAVNIAETTNRDSKALNNFFHDVISMYKNKELIFDCYRQFDTLSKFRSSISYGDDIIYMDDVTEYDLNDIDISYNYINIILPLYRIMCLD